MNILLTGASGFIGRNVSSLLTVAGHAIHPISRSSGCDVAQMLTPTDWEPHLDGIDAVINCVGIIAEQGSQRFDLLHHRAPSALFRACATNGVRRVVQLSALGTDAQAFSAYHRSKLAADECLRSLDLDWIVLHPALVYGLGGTSAELAMRLARLPWIPVVGDGQQRLQPVHIGDMAAAVLHAVTSPDIRQTLDVVGPATITYADWLLAMRHAQGLAPTRLLHVPPSWAKALCHLGRPFHPMLRPDNLRMLQAGYTADPRAFASWLGRSPMPAEPRLFFSDAQTARSTP